MKINMDSARIDAMKAYSELVDLLNNEIACRPRGSSITINPEELDNSLSALRKGLLRLAVASADRFEKFSNLSEDCAKMPRYNPELEEDEL